VHHCVSPCFLDREDHRVVGAKGLSELDNTENYQEQQRNRDAGFDRRGTGFRTAPR
jgi:hypothetical protein